LTFLGSKNGHFWSFLGRFWTFWKGPEGVLKGSKRVLDQEESLDGCTEIGSLEVLKGSERGLRGPKRSFLVILVILEVV